MAATVSTASKGGLILSSLGLKRVQAIDMDKDFVFVVGGHEYRCSRFAAAFLSDNVTKQMLADKTLNSFKLDMEDSNKEFDMVMRLIDGEPIEMNGKNIKYFHNIALKLGNDELQAEIVRLRYLDEEMSPTSIVDRMNTKLKFKASITEEIAYSAANIEQISVEVMKSLNTSVVEAIMTHPDLKLTNEDSLLTIILKLGSKFRFLLQYVQCEYLSNDGITLFLKQIEIKDLNSTMWDSLKRRLTGYVTPKTTLGKRFGGEVFKYDPEKDWNGVFAHMRNKFGANFYNNNIVHTTCPSTYSDNFINIVRPDWEGCIVSSNDESYAHFVVDFKDHRFSPNYYTIRSGSQGCNYLKAWCVEVSNDQKEWIEISRVKSRDMRTNYATRSFPCDCGSFVRYIRFRQTKINTSLNWYLSLSRFELYGTLIKPATE